MNSRSGDEEQPGSWLTIVPNTPVISAEGQEVGTVAEVLGWDREDIFHGLVIHEGTVAQEKLVTADHVKTITNQRVQTDLSSEQVRALEPYVAGATEEGPPAVGERYLDVRESE